MLCLLDGHAIADHIADLVNACITEAIKQATIQTSDDDEEVKHEICFVIIGMVERETRRRKRRG